MSITFGRHALADGTHDLGFERYRIEFPNGYGASVIRGPHSYGGERGLWEVGVTDGGRLTYATDITDDVIGWLDESEVAALLDRIESLDRPA
jgi:hypothetical protein